MQSMLTAGPEWVEGWETHEPDARHWDAQKPLLEQRIDQVNALYDDLVKRAKITEQHGVIEKSIHASQ